METKRCSKCGEVKALECFHRSKQERDGRQYTCKICVNERTRARWREMSPTERHSLSAKRAGEMRAMYLASPDKHKERIEYQRQYYAANRERLKAAAAAYRVDNPEKVQGWRDSWALKNPESVRAARAKYQAAHPEKVRETASRARQQLTDGYVRSVIRTQVNLSANEIPDDLVQLKREAIVLRRLGKQIKTHLKGES